MIGTVVANEKKSTTKSALQASRKQAVEVQAPVLESAVLKNTVTRPVYVSENSVRTNSDDGVTSKTSGWLEKDSVTTGDHNKQP